MLLEKAGKFDLESFDMHHGPIMPSRIHKYDFSDPVVIEVNFLILFFSYKNNLESQKSSSKRSINTSTSRCFNISCNTSSIINIIISSSSTIITCLD